MKIFTIYDSKASAYIQPFYEQTTDTAIRSFTTAVNQEGHQFNQYAEDYTLFELGTWQAEEGTFDLHSTPLAICKAIALLTQTKELTPNV